MISTEVLLTLILIALVAIGFFVVVALLHVVGKMDRVIGLLEAQQDLDIEFEQDEEDERTLTSTA